MSYSHYPQKYGDKFAIRKNRDTVARMEEVNLRTANVNYLDWKKTNKRDVENYIKNTLGYKKVTFFESNKFSELYEKLILETNQKQDENEDLYQFLLDNPEPTDEEFHKWAEDQGKDKHKAEEEAYKLAAKFVRFLKGGRWNEEGPVSYDKDQLEMGIKVEYEHTPDKDVARKIALDHLTELKDYYTRLEKMEKEGKKDL